MGALVTIGSTELPNPSAYNVSIFDITESARNAEGTLIAERKAQKIKIELGWKYLTKAQYATVLGLFSTFFFSVTYHDPTTGTTATKTMYVGDRTSGLFKYNSSTNEIVGWVDVKFALIEE